MALMATKLDIQLDLAEIQKQILLILQEQGQLEHPNQPNDQYRTPPRPCGQMRPVLGIAGAREKYRYKMRQQSGERMLSPYCNLKYQPRRTPASEKVAYAVRSSVQTHIFPRTSLTPRRVINCTPKKQEFQQPRAPPSGSHGNTTRDSSISYDLSREEQRQWPKKIKEPALHEISIIASDPVHPQIREQVSTNESHLQKINFEQMPLHSTMNYPLHSTMATALEPSIVAKISFDDDQENSFTYSDYESVEVDDVKSILKHQVYSAADLAKLKGASDGVRNEQTASAHAHVLSRDCDAPIRDKHPRRGHYRPPCLFPQNRTLVDIESGGDSKENLPIPQQVSEKEGYMTPKRPQPKTFTEIESMMSQHPGCFNLLKSSAKKRMKAKRYQVYNRRDLSRKMKSFQKTLKGTPNGNELCFLAQL